MPEANVLNLDPRDALVTLDYEDPTPAEITDPNHPDYVIPGFAYEVGELPLTTIKRGGYEGARTCTSGPEPGTQNLMSAFLLRYAARGAKNLGIYNCRDVRGGTTTSVHGEGRAGDHGCPVTNDWMDDWCELLIAFSEELGIQCVIYNRRIWSSSYPDAGWRYYDGVNPHVDHAHVEQTRYSGRTLTLDRIIEVLGEIDPVSPPPPPPPPPPAGRPLLKLGSEGQDVRDWQHYLRTVYPAYRHESPVRRGVLLAVDGDFGSWTDSWTRLFQRKSGLGVDGKVGAQTWGRAGF